jgi:hypothetical protein
MTRESKIFGFLPPRSDRTIAPGTLACTATGELIVDVEVERYLIAPEDVKNLIFAGRPAPVTCERVRRRDGVITGQMTIEGHAALNPAGRAVVIQTRAGCWIVPLVSFRRVARGEAASAPLFPLVLEVDVLPSLPQSTLRPHHPPGRKRQALLRLAAGARCCQ